MQWCPIYDSAICSLPGRVCLVQAQCCVPMNGSQGDEKLQHQFMLLSVCKDDILVTSLCLNLLIYTLRCHRCLIRIQANTIRTRRNDRLLIDCDFFMISYFVDRLRTIMITSKLNLKLPEQVFRSEPKVSTWKTRCCCLILLLHLLNFCIFCLIFVV